jgi:hypothetical protein
MVNLRSSQLPVVRWFDRRILIDRIWNGSDYIPSRIFVHLLLGFEMFLVMIHTAGLDMRWTALGQESWSRTGYP